MRVCPFCKEEIRDDAIKCRYCSSSLLPPQPEPGRASATPNAGPDQVVYVLDQGLIRFGKFTAALLAVFVTVGLFLYGIDIKQVAKEVRELADGMERMQRDAANTNLQIQQAKEKVSADRLESENLLKSLKTQAQDIWAAQQNTLRIAADVEANRRQVQSVADSMRKVQSDAYKANEDIRRATNAVAAEQEGIQKLAKEVETDRGTVQSLVEQSRSGASSISQMVIDLRLAVAGTTGSAQAAFIDREVPEQDVGPILTLRDPRVVTLVDMMPRGMSGETGQDSEPFLAVSPDRKLMVGAAYTYLDPDISPLYITTDGGWTWRLQKLLPFQIVSQTYSFLGERNKLLAAVLRVSGTETGITSLSVLQTDDPLSGRQMTELSSIAGAGVDGPYIQTEITGKSRIYVGANDFNHVPHTASLIISTDGGASFHDVILESRDTVGQDSPVVRLSISKDETVYAGFIAWRSAKGSGSDRRFTGDIILCREDGGTNDVPKFSALRDPSDDRTGRIVAQDRTFLFSQDPTLGQQRLGGDLAVATDRNQSSTVYVAWADLVQDGYTLHLRKSSDRGLHWSGDLLSVPSAINPAIAIADDGNVGFLYQQFLGHAPFGVATGNGNWETHFRIGTNAAERWSDMVLTRAPSNVPVAAFQPYIGGHICLASAGGHFYGAFSASNDPNPEHFPQGVHFQRRHRIGTLLNVDGTTPVAVSIDPYFFDIPSKADSH